MDPRTDGELLAACSADPAAMTDLILRYEDLVRRSCRRQAPPGEVEDCVQAVFLVLARRPAAAADAVALAPWLLRVAWHVCARARRAGERRRRAEAGAAAAAVPGGGQRPAGDDAVEHLDACLNRLPEQQRAALCLRFLSGLTPEEVAARLGTSRDNAYKLITRGLAALRGQFARRGIAITGVALGSLLASEAHAAAGTGPLLLSVQPTAKATALAHGAITAMKISAFLPLAGIAGLLVAAGTATLLLTAEPAPAPSGPTPPAPVAQPAPRPADPVTPPAQPAKDLTGGWNAIDGKMAASDLAQQILAHAWLANFAKKQGRVPVMQLGQIAVRGDGETIATQALLDGLRHELGAAPGKLSLLADAASPATVAADIALAGSVVIEVSSAGTSRIRLYTVSFTGADAAGVQAVSVQMRIRKEIQQNAFR